MTLSQQEQEGPKPFDITKLEVPYQRNKTLKYYADYKQERENTIQDRGFYGHFKPLATAQQQQRPREITKEVEQISRLRNKGQEWITYQAVFRSKDWKGNPINFGSMLFGKYQLPQFQLGIDEQTLESDPAKTQVAGWDTYYDIPFTPDTAKELISSSVEGSLTLTVVDTANGGKRYSCNVDEFVNEDFDTLINLKSGFAEYLDSRNSSRGIGREGRKK
jgi:hypothetical protein